MPYILTKF